jgi:GTP cyclohydrolase II
MTDARLERIEKKLDEMGEAIVALARMEERMVSLFKKMDAYDDIQARTNDRIDRLEKVQGVNGQTLRFAERVFWIVISAAVGFMFFKMRNP